MILFNTFKETIFMKDSSELQKKHEALNKLINEYPNNKKITEEMYIVKKGLEGEKEIEYQLKKSNLGLIVLHDINIEYEDMKAQIDYIVISKAYTYFIECKNLTGNIIVNDKGEFIREYNSNNKIIKKGMYSPLRQVEAQRDVYKKIWNNNLSSNKIINNIKRLIAEDNFQKYHKVLVVAANRETILDTRRAPNDIKYKILKSENLVRQLEYDLNHSDKSLWDSKKSMENMANFYLNINNDKNIDYYKYYTNKLIEKHVDIEKLKNKLVEYRKSRAIELNIPAYYIFTNEELDKLVNIRPQSIVELKNYNILSQIKIKMHGEQIIEIINKIINNN